MTDRLSRTQIAWRIAQDIAEGSYVNLGVGMPLLVADYVPSDREVVFHSENGVMGMWHRPPEGKEDPEMINAGKEPIALEPGGAFFHHADSFAMVRGGHLDICVLGAYQVAENGDLANWTLSSNARAPAVGGAMDLAVGARRVFVMMEHCTRDGEPKILRKCTLPLTGVACVDRIFTDLAVIDVTEGGLVVREMVDGMDLDALQALSEAELRLGEDWRRLSAPALAA